MTASVWPSPKLRNLAKTCLMPSLLASISSTVRIWRSRPCPRGRRPCRAAAHQRDRLVAGLLQPVQHHDLYERADMQRRRGAVEADIGGDLARRAPSRRARGIGA